MPTRTIQIRESRESRAQQTYQRKVNISALKKITSVRVFNNKFGVDVQASKISYSINQASKEVTVNAQSLQHTDFTTEYTQYRLTGSSVTGDNRYCTYANGTRRTISAATNCANFIAVHEYVYQYDYDIIIEYTVNTPPTISSDTVDAVTLYEGDIYEVRAEVDEPDADDSVTVYCQVNDDVPQIIGSFTSESIPLLTEREFRYRQGQLIDLITDYRVDVPEDTEHSVKVWATDDYGGETEVIERFFFVDSNQPPEILVDEFEAVSYLLEDEQISITGATSDPNGGEYALSYQLDENSWFDTYQGLDSPFSIALPLPLLTENSVLRIRAVDEFDAADEQIVDIEKELVRYPLHRSDIKYRINIPSRTAQTMTLKVMREIGDLTVTANVSMTGGEADELFVAMTKTGTQAAGEGMEEDTFSYTATETMEKILFQIVMERQDVSSTAKVRRVTGTLN